MQGPIHLCRRSPPRPSLLWAQTDREEEEEKKTMRVTVCQLNNDQGIFLDEWKKLVAHVKSEKSDLVLLPELVFAPWFAYERER